MRGAFGWAITELHTVPNAAPDKIASVVALEITGAPDVEPMPLSQAEDGSIPLPASEATCHGTLIQSEGPAGQKNIGFWANPDDFIEWRITVRQPGTLRVSADSAGSVSTSFTVFAGNSKLEAKSPVSPVLQR